MEAGRLFGTSISLRAESEVVGCRGKENSGLGTISIRGPPAMGKDPKSLPASGLRWSGATTSAAISGYNG